MSLAAVDQLSTSLPRIHSRSRSVASLKCDVSPTPALPPLDPDQMLINSMRFVESPRKSAVVPNHILDTSMSYFFLQSVSSFYICD